MENNVILSPLTYSMLRTTPEGVVTLKNAEDRMYSYLGLNHLCARQTPGEREIDVEDDFGNHYSIVVPVSDELYVDTIACAKLISGPDNFDIKKGISHEFSFETSHQFNELLTKFASMLKTTVDNNFCNAWLLGNAIYQWADANNVCYRESESSMPSGTYRFNVWILTRWNVNVLPSHNGGVFQVDGQWYKPEPVYQTSYKLRRSVYTVILNSDSSSSTPESVGSKKKKKLKKLSDERNRKDSCSPKQQPMQI